MGGTCPSAVSTTVNTSAAFKGATEEPDSGRQFWKTFVHDFLKEDWVISSGKWHTSRKKITAILHTTMTFVDGSNAIC